MENLFKAGDNGTFNNTTDPTGNPPSDWGLTKDSGYDVTYKATNPLTGAGSLRLKTSNTIMELIYETTTSNQTVVINDYLFNNNDTNLNIDWGDGNEDILLGNVKLNHTYLTAGTYNVTITGQSTRLNLGNEPALKYINEFNRDIGVGNNSFLNCTGLIELRNTIPIPFFESVGLLNLFANCSSLTGGSGLLLSPDLSGVTDSSSCFLGCTMLNADISNWDVSNITRMQRMFENCLSFNQNLGGWNINSLTNAIDMFKGATLSTANYDALLIGWEAQAVQNNVTFNGGNSNYTLGGAAETARTNLINDHSWTITDGGGI